MTATGHWRSEVHAEGQREIVLTRSFGAPPTLVFDSWTKPELFARWFAKPGWSLEVVEMHVRPGGTYRYVLKPDSGGDEVIMYGEYREVERPGRLVSTIAFDGFDQIGWRTEDATVSVLQFIEEEPGTRMVMSQSYKSTEVRDAALQHMKSHPGAKGEEAYGRLGRLLEGHETDGGVAVRLLPTQPTVSIRGTVKVTDLQDVMDERVIALRDYLNRHGVEPSAPTYVRYHHFPDIGPNDELGDLETDVEQGFPVPRVMPEEGPIMPGELPGGLAISTIYTGVPEGLGAAYGRIAAWMREHDDEPAGPAWEVYHFVELENFAGHERLPARETWRHGVVQPIKQSRNPSS